MWVYSSLSASLPSLHLARQVEARYLVLARRLRARRCTLLFRHDLRVLIGLGRIHALTASKRHPLCCPCSQVTLPVEAISLPMVHWLLANAQSRPVLFAGGRKLGLLVV